MRKIISIALTLALVAGLALVPVNAAGGSVTPITPGVEGINWYFDSITGKMTFTGSGVMPNYLMKEGEADQRPWASFVSQIAEVEIAEGITAIGDYAFYGCTSLVSVTIPDSVTVIGDYAFSNCAFTEVELPASLTAIGKRAFENCHIIGVEFPASLKSVGDYAFYGTDIAKADLPAGVETIGDYAFAGTPISELTLPETVTSIGEGAFNMCRNLTGVMLPAGITEIAKNTFCGCSALQFVTLPGGLKSIGFCAFDSCESLGSITIPDSVEFIDHGAFYGCTSLKEVRLPASLNAIGDSVFAESKVARVLVPDSATGLTGATFAGMDALEELYISETNTNYLLEDDLLYNFDKTEFITSFKGSDVKTLTLEASVVAISRGAFEENKYLQTVILPDTLETIGDFAFYSSAVTAIRVPASVKEIGMDAFACCRSLTTILVAGKDTAVGKDAFAASTGLVYAWENSPTHLSLEGKDKERFVAIDNDLGFLDVSAKKWSYEGIAYAVTNDLFRGMSTMYFMPEVKMNRAMLVTVIHRLEGEPKASEGYELPFTDVAESAYYYEALRWAAENGVINGVNPTTFAPNDFITREQMVTVLYRYSVDEGAPLSEADLSMFADADKVSAYAVSAMKWAVENGIIEGMGAGEELSIVPKGEATRAQVATVFMRLGNIEEAPDNGEGTEPDNGEGTEPDNGEGTEPDNGEGTEPDNGEGTEPDNGEGEN